MQKLAQSWLVLQISGRPFFLGLDAFLGEIPIFLFSLIGGVIADRVDRRKLLIGSQLVQMTSAFTLAALVYFKWVQVWHILILSFISGFAQAFGGPAYQALIPALVGGKDLQNAIAMNSIQFNLARVIGPVLGGLALTKLGATWCFGLNGLSFVAVIISLSMLSVRPGAASSESLRKSMQEGFQFIQSRDGLKPLIVLAFFMTTFGITVITFLPVVARDVFHGGARAYTLLLSVSGIGAVGGALVVAGLGQVQHKGLVALQTLITLGVLMACFGLSQNLLLSCTLLFIAGGTLMATFAMISSLVQLIAPDNMRGRVMSVYNVAFRGGMPIGSFINGFFIDKLAIGPVLVANGLLLVVLGGYFLFVQRRVAHL